MAKEHRFQYRLEAVELATAKSVKVKFTLTNKEDVLVTILSRNTPLQDRIHTRMFTITCKVEGREENLRLQAPMRSGSETPGGATGKIDGSEQLKNVIRFKPGESRENVIDLVPAYNFPSTGECKIAYTGLISIVQLDARLGGEPKYEFANAHGQPLLVQLTPPND